MRKSVLIASAAALGLFWPPAVQAEKIANQVAVFAALDKMTARIQPLEVPLGKTARFGGLKITPRACYTRSPTEQPITSSFVEVEEVQLDKTETRIFTGWMFAQNPGVHAVEHPVFDVWLTNCKMPAGGKSDGNSWKPVQ
jgi:hypothetical protein